MKYIVYSLKDMLKEPTIMVDNENLLGVYSWEDAGKQIKLLNSLNYKGFNDWRLPSREELEYLYLYERVIGGFADTYYGGSASTYYWSSTEVGYLSAWGQDFGDGGQLVVNKIASARVRAVRAV